MGTDGHTVATTSPPPDLRLSNISIPSKDGQMVSFQIKVDPSLSKRIRLPLRSKDHDSVAKENMIDDSEMTELKIHISRVPTKFDEAIVLRILQEQLLSGDAATDGAIDENVTGESAPIKVELIYPRESTENDREKNVHLDDDDDVVEPSNADQVDNSKAKDDENQGHRGFGFVTFQTKDLYEKAISMPTIKGGRKPTSTKLRTMHLRPYTTSPEEVNQCYLWSQKRCPYGDDCKFTHAGPGACLPVVTDEAATKKKKRTKCFAYKKGKCTKGDDCPFSHDFDPVSVKPKDNSDLSRSVPQSEKDCINWKTKGKCRKGDDCPYRHDPELLEKVEAKKKKRKREEQGEDAPNAKKEKQPLCIRVFGMAYETTEEDIRAFFEECGKIQDVSFPTFDDSGRSKGYCGIWFSSPKAVAKAIELNGKELLGRWLSVQAGKMYLKEWEANHHGKTGRSLSSETASFEQ